jgi:hypothetical protein
VERYMDNEKNIKIFEVHIGKPGHHVSRRRAAAGNHHHSQCSTMT